jgi:hypothetical protein
MSVSPQRRQDIIDALRRGTVPQYGLDALAVGLEPFEPTFNEEIAKVARGGAVFKALRGEYGSGKTFTLRWLQERARRQGFACSEVQISETETPLHRLETVYRRLMERLTTPDTPSGAFRSVIEAWFYALEEEVLSGGDLGPEDLEALVVRTDGLMERRLGEVVKNAPAFGLTLRAYRRAAADGDDDLADGLLAWMAGQPNISAAVKRAARIKGDIDHFGALSFLQGVLTILKDSGHPGLMLVLDEVETLQRMRGDTRDKSLNALHQLMDEIDSGRFPGLFLVITGTPAFFDGPMGVQRLPPLARRLAVDFATDPRFDNPRAPQIRLKGFDSDSRRQVEELAFELRALGVSTFVSHSSLSLEARRHAEQAFAEGSNCVIVATSTLELGIDVGDLDRVIQIDAPFTVVAFLQRSGAPGGGTGPAATACSWPSPRRDSCAPAR